MENSTVPDGAKETPNSIIPAVVQPNQEANKNDTKGDGSVTHLLPPWLKVVLIILPALAFIISLFSLCVSVWSLRFSMGYTRPYEDHDVVARVLGVTALTKGFSSIETNGELFVDLALINRGNQTEIIRESFLCYSDSKDFVQRGQAWGRDNKQINLQFNKGDRKVLHVSTPYSQINTGKRMWLGIVVRAVAPNADDIEVVWPICEINLAPDGNGSWVSYNKDQTPQIQIISNQRMPNQRIAPDGL